MEYKKWLFQYILSTYKMNKMINIYKKANKIIDINN